MGLFNIDRRTARQVFSENAGIVGGHAQALSNASIGMGDEGPMEIVKNLGTNAAAYSSASPSQFGAFTQMGQGGLDTSTTLKPKEFNIHPKTQSEAPLSVNLSGPRSTTDLYSAYRTDYPKRDYFSENANSTEIMYLNKPVNNLVNQVQGLKDRPGYSDLSSGDKGLIDNVSTFSGDNKLVTDYGNTINSLKGILGGFLNMNASSKVELEVARRIWRMDSARELVDLSSKSTKCFL